MVADDLKSPWKLKGLVIRHDQNYDSCQSRDSSIDIVDGTWMCLYRDDDYQRNVRMVLATSTDGITWGKHGPLRVDGQELNQLRMSGTTYSETCGTFFIGVYARLGVESLDYIFYDKWQVPHGRRNDFVAYEVEIKDMNLRTIFRRSTD